MMILCLPFFSLIVIMGRIVAPVLWAKMMGPGVVAAGWPKKSTKIPLGKSRSPWRPRILFSFSQAKDFWAEAKAGKEGMMFKSRWLAISLKSVAPFLRLVPYMTKAKGTPSWASLAPIRTKLPK